MPNFSLELILDTVRIENGKPSNRAANTITSEDLEKISKDNEFGYKFNFYRLISNHKSADGQDLEEEVYNRVNGNIFADGQVYNFSFKIDYYHEILRYKMDISHKDNRLIVRVVDADFKFKHAFFEVQENP